MGSAMDECGARRHVEKAFIGRAVLVTGTSQVSHINFKHRNDECPRDIVSVWAYQPRLLYLRGLRVVVSMVKGNARASVAGTTSREFTLFLYSPADITVCASIPAATTKRPRLPSRRCGRRMSEG